MQKKPIPANSKSTHIPLCSSPHHYMSSLLPPHTVSLSADMTVCGSISNPTFPTLVKLLDGGYGQRARQPGHTIIAVNSSWSAVPTMWLHKLCTLLCATPRELKQRAAVAMGEAISSSTAQGQPPGGVFQGALWNTQMQCTVRMTLSLDLSFNAQRTLCTWFWTQFQSP